MSGLETATIALGAVAVVALVVWWCARHMAESEAKKWTATSPESDPLKSLKSLRRKSTVAAVAIFVVPVGILLAVSFAIPIWVQGKLSDALTSLVTFFLGIVVTLIWGHPQRVWKEAAFDRLAEARGCQSTPDGVFCVTLADVGFSLFTQDAAKRLAKAAQPPAGAPPKTLT